MPGLLKAIALLSGVILWAACGTTMPRVGVVPPPPPPPPLEERHGFEIPAWDALAAEAFTLAPALAERGDALTLDSAAIVARHALGDTALVRIHRGIANVNQVLRAAQMATAIGLAANPWSDEGFRNLWDRIENVGTTLGLGYATYSALRTNENASHQARSIGWGLLLASGAKGISGLLGNQSGEQFERKARFVEFTRRAYDHLQTVYVFTQADVVSNRELRTEIDEFRAKYNAARTVAEKRDQLILATAYLTRYDLVLTQIPSAVQRYRSAIERFCPGVVQAVRDNPSSSHACTVREGNVTYQIEGDSRDRLIAAARQLVEMEAEMDDANEVRLLSSRLRQALLAGA